MSAGITPSPGLRRGFFIPADCPFFAPPEPDSEVWPRRGVGDGFLSPLSPLCSFPAGAVFLFRGAG